MVNVLPPLVGVIVPPPPVAPVLADSTPAPSDRMTVNVSPVVVGDLRVILTASDRACVIHSRIVAAAGAEIDSLPVAGVTVTGSDFVAVLPKLSVAATVSVSALVELSSSFRVVRSASTWDSVPAMVNVLLPLEDVIVPPPPVASRYWPTARPRCPTLADREGFAAGVAALSTR